MAGIGAYDPRRQAHVSLTYKNDQTHLSATKSCELSQLYQTSRATGSRPSTGPKKGDSKPDVPYLSRQLTEFETHVHPPFLDRNCRWDQKGLPTLMAHTQGQPLTTTGRLDGTLGAAQAVRPISSIHSYNDISPVLTTEFVRDTDRSEATWDATINKRGTQGVHQPTGPTPPSKVDVLVESLRPATTKSIPTSRDPARTGSVEAFWQRTGGSSSTNLKQQDVVRIGSEVGTHSVPGSGNARLVAGKWRYIPRPTEGTHLYTDYYGRFDSKPCDYFGRVYHYKPQ